MRAVPPAPDFPDKTQLVVDTPQQAVNVRWPQVLSEKLSGTIGLAKAVHPTLTRSETAAAIIGAASYDAEDLNGLLLAYRKRLWHSDPPVVMRQVPLRWPVAVVGKLALLHREVDA